MNATLTQSAEKFIRRMLRFASGTQSGFRLRVSPGGCSGLAAEFDLEAAPQSDDLVWERSGIRIFLDSRSTRLLNGMIVDFVDTLSHTGFTFTPQTAASPLLPVEALLRR